MARESAGYRLKARFQVHRGSGIMALMQQPARNLIFASALGARAAAAAAAPAA